MTQRSDTVVDEQANDRFLYIEDGLEAQLNYRTRPGELILVRTLVPDAIGHRGIGGRLVQAAAERAKATGETVLPWCPYARKWLQDHPDLAAEITIDWSNPA